MSRAPAAAAILAVAPAAAVGLLATAAPAGVAVLTQPQEAPGHGR